MAAVHPYQRVLLANRDILLSDLPTEDVINFLEDHKVLSVQETDDIKIGRSQRERRESLLDVLHYKGERGFNEFCKALDEYAPDLAARMSDKDPKPELNDKYYNERNTSTKYSSSYTEYERGYREINGDDFQRESSRDKEEKESKAMRDGGPEPHYARVHKRPRDYDRAGDDNRSVGSHHSRHSERGGRGDDFRKTPRRGDELNPAEHYILEKQTILLEKANINLGFGIAVSGGLDNPHYKTGDTSIVVSDIVPGSPAHGLLRENDIIVQVNDVNVEKCYHRDAVQALKDAGTSARLIIMRRKVMPHSAVASEGRMDRSYHSSTLPTSSHESKMDRSYQSATLPDRRSRSMPPTTTIHIKKPEKEGFGFSMAFRLYVKDVKRKGVAQYAGLQRDHVIQKINGRKTEELSLKEAIEMVRNSQDLDLVVAEKKLDRYSSTKSLPSVGKRPLENGYDNHKEDEPIDRRRAKSLDRKYIKDMRRSRGSSDDVRDKEDKLRVNDGISVEKEVELESKPVTDLIQESEIKAVEANQELRNYTPDDVFKKLESEKPPEPVVVKQEVKAEESVPDIPPRRYSDPDLPPPPKLDEPDKGLETTWKRLQPADQERDRDSDRGRDHDRDRDHERDYDKDRDYNQDRDHDRDYGRDRDHDHDRDRDHDRHRDRDYDRDRDEEPQPYVPQPADVTRTDGQMDLSHWDQGLSPGRDRRDRSPGSTPQMDRRENTMDFINDRDTKSITFRKEGSLGIQIQGGNKVGIFVNAVRENNPAYKNGLRRGDQILMANDIDFRDITREEAVLLLLSLGDEVHLYSRPKMSTFERIRNSPGDSFYIKCHFDYVKMKPDTKPEELDMNREDVFHVWDTMYGGMIGSWHAQRVTLNNEETDTGVIPNKCRAEQLATVRQVEEEKTPRKAQRTNSLKRRLSKKYSSQSTDKLDQESFINMSKEFKLPAYERVSLRSPGFVRPVVLVGPIADITRDKLLQDMPDVFAVPTAYGGYTPAGHDKPTNSTRRYLSYSAIKAVVDSGKHCLLDIAPEEVERLNYCQFYPIVIFMKPPSKTVLKEMRTQHGSSGKNAKKLYDNSVKIDQLYSKMFSATIAAGPNDDWYTRVKEEIRRQQDRRVWMSEDKFEHEDMEFTLHPSRYSTGHEYDPHGDSPTTRSSISHPPEEEIHAEPAKGLESTPQMYNGPEVEYRLNDDRPRYDDRRDRYDDDRDRDGGRYDDRDRDGGRYDDRDRDRYDDRGRDRGRYDDRDRDHYGDEGAYDSDRASKPGYKPHGNVVKVLPSSQEPGELRQSLRKTQPQDFADHPPDHQDGDHMLGRDNLRKTDYEPRPEGPNPTELELKKKAESLRKVQGAPDELKEYDDMFGVRVSELWAIDNDRKRDEKRDRIQPVQVAPVESKPDDLELRLTELEKAIPATEVKKPVTAPKPYRFESKQRNIIVDSRPGDRSDTFVRTTYYPVKSRATVTHIGSKSEPEIRAHFTDRVESAPIDNKYGSLPRDYGQRTEQDSALYRTEVTLPRTEGKTGRPRSAYGYSSQAYAPKPFSTDHRSSSPPPRPAQPSIYDYRLSKPDGKREPEPRPGTFRSDYRTTKLVDNDESQAITSDFESLDDDTQVVATARGTFTSEGGVLSSPETGVSIHIPEGAIKPGIEQEIYFKVCKDNNIMPPLDADKGETLLSPLVMCGPHGTQFTKPVELRLPHCASMTPDGWSFALKSSDTPTGMPTQWHNVSLPGQENKDKCQVDPNSVSVLVDHF